MSNILLHTLVV